MPNNASQKKLYDSIVMLHPDGTKMCLCSERRANWYIKRGLGEFISEREFKLKFEPNGKGKSESEYYVNELENKCVVCGAEERLNKHHIVPYVFRSRLPNALKRHNHHDIVGICVDCHEEYEEYANQYKKELAKKVNAEFNRPKTPEEKENSKIYKARKALEMIASGEMLNVPLDRIRELEIIASKPYYEVKENDTHWADEIMMSLKNEKDIRDFIVSWRKHFVEIMKPKFMSKYWTIDFDLEYAAEDI